MHRKQQSATGFLILAAALTIGCAFSITPDWVYAEEEKMTLILRSTAFTDGGEIPTMYTCEGEDLAPPLAWEGVPKHARSLVLIVDDPDAPDPKAPRMTWVHWVLYNIPPETTEFPAGMASRLLPPGTEEGLNDWKKTGYGGPCPPIGRHRYFHKLYALDAILKLSNHPTKATIEAVMEGRVIVQTELVGTYQKSR